MALEQTDVEKIAQLAALKLNESDLAESTVMLNNILQLVDRMQAVDTNGIEPLAHPLEATQRLRPDMVTEENHRDEYQKIAPSVSDGLYLVPKVID
ncbi:Asp-tRNA(Asn)/Glu-tRNA(Gln) amidotransferase subunit GatC [Entomomonas moraniae]|uniref:Aspartyl/glutamyl-tRNA(Asn/Gln) amidotransferase subunit C n=1 Tax=Entomomonas moraniae TaxID=2213226 RepID=A0A3Q9JP44_9GAMM|nr:Asp-tRNA(Asn)/Glu-tRNA(Gln) amidotransferase subunit GatC [Entomomonas moraniae]AZS51961.1 Asp-tRNA(Asn)/Glu-tRNA(Gln) amidotransferase subunit GatC [Entomomonas moraniae]